MHYNIKNLGLIVLAALTATACSDYDFYEGTAKELAYTKNFTQQFGKIDSNQDWNLSSLITANYDLTHLPLGEYTIRIFSEHPSSDHTMLLASYKVASDTAGSFNFDAIKGSNQVFVVVLSENNQLVDMHSVALNGTTIDLSNSAITRAAAEAWSPSIGEKVDGGTPLYLNDGTAYIYPMNGLVMGDVSGLTKADVQSIFLGEGAVFAEEVDNGATHPNLIRDVTFTMKEKGEFKMNLVWSITSNHDAFGYYYQDENGKYHLYRIFDDIQSAFSLGTTAPGSLLNGYVNSVADDAAVNAKVYKLAYVDKNGNIGSEFPAGTKIGFFLIQDAMSNTSGWQVKPSSYQDYNVMYSQKKLNWKVSSVVGNAGVHDLGNTWSAYFKYGDKLYLGFEDWKKVISGNVFNDYNDIVFYIDAPVEEAENPELDITPEKMTETIVTESAAAIWTLAFEDLGDTYDFDFNDVVLQFKHVSGSKTAQVNLAAAGGTLEAHVNWDGADKGAEIHAAFGVSQTTPVNVNATDGASKATIESFITLDDLASEFTIGDLSKFSLHVVYGDASTETAALIPAGGPNTKGKAPQCLVVPGKWVWPQEFKSIFNAYTQFGEWASGWSDSKGSWEANHRYGSTDLWYKPNAEKNNYNLALLTNDPTQYYTEQVGGAQLNDQVTVENGKVTYHVNLANVGNSKYYGGTLYLKIADWKSDFSSESDYKTVVLKNVQTGSAYTLNIDATTAGTTEATASNPGYTVTVATDGSAQIAITLPSDFAQSLLGSYTGEASNENNNKFDVTCYASSMDAWIISNAKPSNYTGELPTIDADDGSNYPDEITVPSGTIDLASCLNSSSIVIPNKYFNHNGSVTLSVVSGSVIYLGAEAGGVYYFSNNTSDSRYGMISYGQKDFTFTKQEVAAIYTTGSDLTITGQGTNDLAFVRAMWLTQNDPEAEPQKWVPDGYSAEDEVTNGQVSSAVATSAVANNNLTVGVEIAEGVAAETTITVKIANSHEQTFTVEAGKTFYEVEFSTVTNLQYNYSIAISGTDASNIKSVWAKVKTQSQSQDPETSAVTLTFAKSSNSTEYVNIYDVSSSEFSQFNSAIELTITTSAGEWCNYTYTIGSNTSSQAYYNPSYSGALKINLTSEQVNAAKESGFSINMGSMVVSSITAK